MITVDHCEAYSHSFCLRAFYDRKKFAVAAGAPDDLLCAHLFVSIDDRTMLSPVVRMVGCNLAWQREETSGGGGEW